MANIVAHRTTPLPHPSVLISPALSGVQSPHRSRRSLPALPPSADRACAGSAGRPPGSCAAWRRTRTPPSRPPPPSIHNQRSDGASHPALATPAQDRSDKRDPSGHSRRLYRPRTVSFSFTFVHTPPHNDSCRGANATARANVTAIFSVRRITHIASSTSVARSTGFCHSHRSLSP